MPVTTSVYIHDPVDYRIVFARCVVLIGASARTRTGDDGGMIFTCTDQGQLAWTWVKYGNDGPPLRTAAVPHTGHFAPGCADRHAPAGWIEAVFDADDGYRDDHGGPGALHQRLVTALGQWLDAQAVRWSWRTHGDGVLHERRDGLAGLSLLAGSGALGGAARRGVKIRELGMGRVSWNPGHDGWHWTPSIQRDPRAAVKAS